MPTAPLCSKPRARRFVRSVSAATGCPARLVLTQDLNGEISRLRDNIRDRQFLLTSGALIGNATCVEKVCGGRCLDRKIHVLWQIPQHWIQLTHDHTNHMPASVENRPAAVSPLHWGRDLDLMRIRPTLWLVPKTMCAQSHALSWIRTNSR